MTDDEFHSFCSEVREFRKESQEARRQDSIFQGRVDAKLEGLEEHIKSVSENSKATQQKLDDHKESMDAHGLGSAKRGESGVLSWVALALAAVGTYLGIKGSH